VGVGEKHYWTIALCLPALVGAALASDAAAAGCYATWMSCFSIFDPNTFTKRAILWTARYLPYALPAYAPVALYGFAVLLRRGVGAFERWLWLAPVFLAAALHVSCTVFSSWVMPARRLGPSLLLDLQTLAGAYAWIALLRVAKPGLVRAPGFWDPP